MDGSNLGSKIFLISQTAVLLIGLLANPALSQDFGFLDYNQSRRFFDQGNKQFEQEIKLLEANIEPVKIKLPQDSQQPDSGHQQQNLQPNLNLTSNDEESRL